MFGQISLDILLLFMLYATGATTAAIACLYLLLRRGNAFAPDVVSPVRLRRWTAAFFAALAMGHLWYMPAVVFTSSDAILLSMLVGGLLDCLLVIPLAIIILFCMLQDRRSPACLHRSATGSRQRLSELQYLQSRLQAAHGSVSNSLDAPLSRVNRKTSLAFFVLF